MKYVAASMVQSNTQKKQLPPRVNYYGMHDMHKFVATVQVSLLDIWH